MVRDKETGKSRGFAFLKYEDQRSTDLAVDNLTGTVVLGRTLRVDHTRYKKKADEPDEGLDLIEAARVESNSGNVSEEEAPRAMLEEERELALLIKDHDDDDPMKAFLIEEKKEEISKVLLLLENAKSSGRKHVSKHKHHRSHRARDRDDNRERSHRSRRHEKHESTRSRRSRSPERRRNS